MKYIGDDRMETARDRLTNNYIEYTATVRPVSLVVLAYLACVATGFSAMYLV